MAKAIRAKVPKIGGSAVLLFVKIQAFTYRPIQGVKPIFKPKTE